jgi:hypothetical protein
MDIRLARPDDTNAVAHVHARAWQVGYRGLLTDGYLDSLRAEDRAARYDFMSADPSRPSTLVAVDCGMICGFATLAPAAETDIWGTTVEEIRYSRDLVSVQFPLANRRTPIR